MKKVGVCQMAQAQARSTVADKAEPSCWRRGNAKPRHPASSPYDVSTSIAQSGRTPNPGKPANTPRSESGGTPVNNDATANSTNGVSIAKANHPHPWKVTLAASSRRTPLRPSSAKVTSSAARAGPNSPGTCVALLPKSTRAPESASRIQYVHERRYATTKYVATGCRRTKPAIDAAEFEAMSLGIGNVEGVGGARISSQAIIAAIRRARHQRTC